MYFSVPASPTILLVPRATFPIDDGYVRAVEDRVRIIKYRVGDSRRWGRNLEDSSGGSRGWWYIIVVDGVGTVEDWGVAQ